MTQCVRETRASGQYEIQMIGIIPQVAPRQGATQRGAANVNDCLADKYQVQPGRVISAAASAPVAAVDNANLLDCAKILTRTPGEAAAYAFGASVLAGAVGASIQAGTYQRKLQACLASTGGKIGSGIGVTLNGGCRAGGLMVRGSRYCNG